MKERDRKQLPNASLAVVDEAKLRDYCLNSQHPEGRHKARVFLSALGITRTDSAALKSVLLRAALEAEAIEGECDEHGQRYVIDFLHTNGRGIAKIRLRHDYPQRAA